MGVFQSTESRLEDDGPLGDEELVAALAADLAGSFERLVLAYQDRLYAFALRLTDSPRDAEEIAQDAFVRAYRALCAYPPERVQALALRAWLYQITLNVARNRLRGKRLQTVSLDHPAAEHHVEPPDGDSTGPESSWERAEGSRELAARLAALPERYRVAVILRHVQGLPYGEAAELLGQPIGTVKANVHRGVRLLREAMNGRAGSELGSTGVLV